MIARTRSRAAPTVAAVIDPLAMTGRLAAPLIAAATAAILVALRPLILMSLR